MLRYSEAECCWYSWAIRAALACCEHTPSMQCRHRSKGQSCSSSLDMKYLLYVPVFTDLNSLIVRNAYISSLRNPLQINESFRLIPSYGCRDSQLPGQRGERDLLFKAALTTALSTLRGPNPSNL